MAVLGATGYIGRFVVLELVKRGFQVLAVTRPSSGIGSKQKVSDVEKVTYLSVRRKRWSDLCVVSSLVWGGARRAAADQAPFYALLTLQ